MSQYPVQIPDLVHQAKALAHKLGFDLRPEGNPAGGNQTGPSCCIDEVGNLLRVLSTSITSGKIGEIGTGAGVGSAWIISGLNPGVPFNTVETDGRLAATTTELFNQYPNVKVYHEDWRQSFVSDGPYDLIFADGGGVGSADQSDWPAIQELLVPGGTMVIDDLTPEELWPDSWRGNPDPKRELAFNSGLFESVEVRSRPDVSTLIMVRPTSR